MAAIVTRWPFRFASKIEYAWSGEANALTHDQKRMVLNQVVDDLDLAEDEDRVNALETEQGVAHDRRLGRNPLPDLSASRFDQRDSRWHARRRSSRASTSVPDR